MGSSWGRMGNSLGLLESTWVMKGCTEGRWESRKERLGSSLEKMESTWENWDCRMASLVNSWDSVESNLGM